MRSVVVAAPPAVQEPGDLLRLPPCADLVELRLDLLPGGLQEARVPAWVAASPRPALATVRSRREGGAFDGSAPEAARLLGVAARAGAAWIDVERAVAPHVGPLPPGTRVLASCHGAGDAPPAREVAGRAPDAFKIARPVGDATSLARLLDEDARAPAATTLVPYGPLGALRTLFVASPGALLFGAASDASAVVPGQPGLVSLRDDLRAGEVTPAARLYGLLGSPPTTSPSPSIHNAVFRSLYLDSLYVPLPGLSLQAALSLPFHGYSVTTPFKREAAQRADGRSPEVEATGACNTLVRRDDGSWFARNTDVEAVEVTVPQARPGETAFVYGAGGFARAAVFALGRRGYGVRLAARRRDAGAATARECAVPFAGDVYRREPSDRIVVNATAAGADGADVPAFPHALLEGLTVLDAPYASPGRETGLVEAARRSDASRVVTGLDLLVAQAFGQSIAFTGQPPEEGVLRRAVRPLTNLVLVGLRGAGKTTVGRIVAERLGRPFLDLDAEVARLAGRRSAGTLIREQGLEAFRDVEAEAVDRVRGRRGLVVATGGGVLERPANVRALREGGVGVWLDLPPEAAARRVAAAAEDRPPLLAGSDAASEALEIHRRRAPAYRAFSVATVDAQAPAGIVAQRVLEAWVAADAP